MSKPLIPALPKKIRPDEEFESRALRQFHDVFGHRNGFTDPLDMDSLEGKKELVRRFNFLGEEFAELGGAIFDEVDRLFLMAAINFVISRHRVEDLKVDKVEVIDALGDIRYIDSGMFVCFGVPLEYAAREIHASNMSKLGADGKPIYREDGKILKGENYVPPNLAPLLEGKVTENMESWVTDDE